jgi:hypothetical protein
MPIYYIVRGQKVRPDGQPYIEAVQQPVVPTTPAEPETIVPGDAGVEGGDPVSAAAEAAPDYSALTVPGLKALCETRGLSVVSTGKRSTHPLERDYIAALVAADEAR